MHTLRKQLQIMAEIDDVSRHPVLLDAIALECPNTIRRRSTLRLCVVHEGTGARIRQYPPQRRRRLC